MTDTVSQEKIPDDELAKPTEAELPAPEPWTAQRVFEWNSYYDLYVAGFVILLAFLGVANKIPAMNSGIWSLLQAGRQIAETGAPVVADTTSIAGEGRRWVNIPWLYEVSQYRIYKTAASLAPKPEVRTGAAKVSGPGEQYGAGALIAVDSLARVLAALLLLGVRRKGPGLWWSAICVTIALGVTLGPATIDTISATATGEMVRSVRPGLGVQFGGIASPPSVVGPESWGLLLLAVELLLLHQAINLGKRGRLFAMIPLFLVWANVDESYAVGLVILAASTIGMALDARRDPSRPSAGSAWLALGLSFAATFASPSHYYGVLAAFGSIAAPFAALLRSVGLKVGQESARSWSLLASNFGPGGISEVVKTIRFYYLGLVGLGLASFALNRRDFSMARFLTFVAASALWGLVFNVMTAPFALVLAATVAINGQEWYQRTFGVEGKLGTGWTIWSTGGRLVTLLVVCAAIARSVTGWGGQVGDPQFGFGFNPDDFPFESAEAIRDAPIEGGILNTSLPQGDAIAWKAASKRKAFVDSRLHLYPTSVYEELRELRNDIKNDDIAKWQPALDRLKISAVMIQPTIGSPQDIAPNTYAKLFSSPNWIPFYDDGMVVIFGRADANANSADLAYFKANRLDADERVYKSPRVVAAWERPPTPTQELIDSIFQNRQLVRPQPHTVAALHWLEPANITPGKPYLADPAHCLMAIREARTALSMKPDDSTAFQILIEAYQKLLVQESALVLGIQPTPENLPRIAQAPSQARFLMNRNRQILTAFNFRLMTLPPSKTREDKAVKADLNYKLAQLYLQSNALDLARERLEKLAEEIQDSGMDEQSIRNLTKQRMDLNDRIEQIRERMVDMGIRRASPQEKADFARRNGAPGLAIHELEEVNDAGGNVPGVRPLLVDLYCEYGQPDKALDVISSLNPDDPTLSTGIGTASYRWGLVYLLLGNYTNAADLWQSRAIEPLRTVRSLDGLKAGQLLLGGEPVASVRTFLDLPEKVNIQAEWEFELGMAGLEGGLPVDFVASHLQAALKLEPGLTVRPLIAYYLEKLGREVPPPRPSTAPVVPAATPTIAPTPAPKPTPKPTPTSKDPLPDLGLPVLPGSEKPELPDDVFARDPKS